MKKAASSLERAALVSLLHPPREFKWAAFRDHLVEDETLPSEVLLESLTNSVRRFDDEIELSLQRIRNWESLGYKFMTYLDSEYPIQLREIHDFPPFLFARGTPAPEPQREPGISIVGSRSASPAAIRDAGALALALARAGVTVISGLAAGIDAAAHSAALSIGGRTVGIIGTGIDKYYPKSSEAIQRRLEKGDGLVLSQFWPGSSPTKYSFPMRNTVMSGYSRGTVIVEASEKSGTRHQAQRAVQHGRPLVLSRAVASDTSWGRKLSSDPKRTEVYVADNLDHAIELALYMARPQRAAIPSPDQLSLAWQ